MTGQELTAKIIGKAVRAALRSHPELQQATLKQLREHLEAKLSQELAAWRDEIRAATDAFMGRLAAK